MTKNQSCQKPDVIERISLSDSDSKNLREMIRHIHVALLMSTCEIDKNLIEFGRIKVNLEEFNIWNVEEFEFFN